ncbi:unnamed protein product [Danaus chrysippus]|uniref:(African queen) hypothetical protein n=1 Tax=Danaus chrysippus TaxID=151541 RepID=A0A8J2QSX9_9NEOP|nr:unnamed protein product [Danaus chrysippus]
MLSESLKDARKSERQITVCWIDLENAFGSIQHELMLFALRWYNFPPLVRDMIASYYSKLRFSIITKEGPSKSLSYNVGLFQVDKFCEWTDGLRTKPSKCHCLCLGRRNTRYTSYDPGLSLGGQCISTVTENAPFKFLGRKIDNIGRTPSLEGIVDSFLNDLNKLDAGVIKMLKLWLGLALTADSSVLFRGSNSFGMSLKRPSELYKHLRVSKRYILGKSHDDIVTSLPKDEDAPEMINIRSMQ